MLNSVYLLLKAVQSFLYINFKCFAFALAHFLTLFKSCTYRIPESRPKFLQDFSARPLIEEEQFSHGRIILDGEEFDRADIVAMLEAVADAEDGEYVTIDDQEDHVRISKEGESVLVHVEERDRRTDEIETRVDVTIPVAVLDALASGDEDELDVMAALEVLAEQPMKGDLVTVNDDESTVRIWVDRRNQSD